MAAVAIDLIPAEADCRSNFQLAGPLQGHRLDHEAVGGISLPFCPMVLRMLIPRYGKDFTDSPPNVLLLD